MRRPEQDLQRACVKYMRLQYPKVLCFHVPNEGTRSRTRGAILKGLGVVAGVPDLLIFEPQINVRTRNYSGLAIELKSAKGKLTAAQLAVHGQLFDAGWDVRGDCRSFDDFKIIVDTYLKVGVLQFSGNDRAQLTEGQ